jgi:hypothetical protein
MADRENQAYQEQRRIALRHHCRLAVETMHPRFRLLGPGAAYSVILTVNSGYE